MVDAVPLHMWTMRNSLGPIPEELRGPAYNEHRIMVIGRSILFGKQYHGDKCIYSIIVHKTADQAYRGAIKMTEALEKEGHRLHVEPKELTYIPNTEYYYSTRDGFVGPDDAIDRAYGRVLIQGRVVA